MSGSLKQVVDTTVAILAHYIPTGSQERVAERMMERLGSLESLGSIHDAKYTMAAAFDDALMEVLEELGVQVGISWGPTDLELFNARNKARSKKDYTEADRLRDDLNRRGHTIKDLN